MNLPHKKTPIPNSARTGLIQRTASAHAHKQPAVQSGNAARTPDDRGIIASTSTRPPRPCANAVQPKMMPPAQPKARPTAPPVYRPQPLPKVLQTKSINKPAMDVGITARGKQAVAPPVYRPQPLPKVLQRKADAHGSQASNTPTVGHAAHRLESPKARQTTAQPGARTTAARWNNRPAPIIQRSEAPTQNVTTVDELCAFLNGRIGANNWAFTGSYALHLHASKSNISFRAYADLDILVDSNTFDEAVLGLIVDAGFKGSPPTTNKTQKSGLQGSGFKLDVLRTGATFGALDDVESVGRYRVVATKTLKQQKAKIRDDEDTEEPDKQKAIQDIATIDSLNKQQKSCCIVQ